MRQQLQLLLVTLAVGLSLAQTSYVLPLLCYQYSTMPVLDIRNLCVIEPEHHNVLFWPCLRNFRPRRLLTHQSSDDGQYTGWGESTTQECDGCDEYTSTTWYPSYTTWTSCYVYGTVTITVTSTVPCDTTTWDSWTTTTTTESVCADCEPVTTYCPPDCGSVTTTECPEGEVGCNGQGEYSTQVEQGDPQPYSTMTYEPEPGSTVVVVMYPGTTTAASGQTGVVQVISSGAEAGKRWGDEMWIGCVLAVAGVLGIVLL